VLAWIYPITTSSSAIVGSDGILFQVASGLTYYVNVISGNACHGTSSTLTLNTWNFVGVTSENVTGGQNCSFYINGKLNSITLASGNRLDPVTQYAMIGCFGPTCSNRKFNGIIDEVMIWNRALSSDEISQLYNSTFASNRFNLTTSFQEIYYNRQMNSTNTTNIWMWMDLNNCPSGTIYSREFELKSCCMNCSCW